MEYNGSVLLLFFPLRRCFTGRWDKKLHKLSHVGRARDVLAVVEWNDTLCKAPTVQGSHDHPPHLNGVLHLLNRDESLLAKEIRESSFRVGCRRSSMAKMHHSMSSLSEDVTVRGLEYTVKCIFDLMT